MLSPCGIVCTHRLVLNSSPLWQTGEENEEQRVDCFISKYTAALAQFLAVICDTWAGYVAVITAAARPPNPQQLKKWDSQIPDGIVTRINGLKQENIPLFFSLYFSSGNTMTAASKNSLIFFSTDK